MNAVLSVEKFSCITEAFLSVSRCTVIIGEQATGKSIISKLLYFMNNIIVVDFFRINDVDNISEFKSHISESFEKWFPPLAWGDKRFSIRFSTGDISIEIRRKGLGKKSKFTRLIPLAPV